MVNLNNINYPSISSKGSSSRLLINAVGTGLEALIDSRIQYFLNGGDSNPLNTPDAATGELLEAIDTLVYERLAHHGIDITSSEQGIRVEDATSRYRVTCEDVDDEEKPYTGSAANDNGAIIRRGLTASPESYEIVSNEEMQASGDRLSELFRNIKTVTFKNQKPSQPAGTESVGLAHRPTSPAANQPTAAIHSNHQVYNSTDHNSGLGLAKPKTLSALFAPLMPPRPSPAPTPNDGIQARSTFNPPPGSESTTQHPFVSSGPVVAGSSTYGPYHPYPAHQYLHQGESSSRPALPGNSLPPPPSVSYRRPRLGVGSWKPPPPPSTDSLDSFYRAQPSGPSRTDVPASRVHQSQAPGPSVSYNGPTYQTYQAQNNFYGTTLSAIPAPPIDQFPSGNSSGLGPAFSQTDPISRAPTGNLFDHNLLNQLSGHPMSEYRGNFNPFGDAQTNQVQAGALSGQTIPPHQTTEIYWSDQLGRTATRRIDQTNWIDLLTGRHTRTNGVESRADRVENRDYNMDTLAEDLRELRELYDLQRPWGYRDSPRSDPLCLCALDEMSVLWDICSRDFVS